MHTHCKDSQSDMNPCHSGVGVAIFWARAKVQAQEEAKQYQESKG